MNERRTPLEKEEPKHKKKSKKKGQPRADHKHEYKTVLLYSYFDNPFKPGVKNEKRQIVEVCTTCGRVGKVIRSIFDAVQDEECEGLEKWYLDDFFDKFAKRYED